MLVKVLERLWVIRAFGVGLVFAPLMNVCFTAYGIAGKQTIWSWQLLFNVFKKTSTPQKALLVASVIIGLLILRKGARAWAWVLSLLGGYIVIQLTRLAQDYKADKMSMFFFAVNVALFFFIADQLVWKQKKPGEAAKAPEPVKAPEPAVAAPALPQEPPATSRVTPQAAPEPVKPILTVVPPAQQAREKVLVHLDGFGQWAQLVDVTGTGIRVRSTVDNPPEIGDRELEVTMSKDLVLRMRFAVRNGNDYFFEYVGLNQEKTGRLNQWLEQKAAA